MNDIAHNTTLLIQAATIGDAAEVQRLIPVSDPKFDDSRALRTAAEKGHFECVKLLAAVSDPKSMNSKALEWAAYIGHLEMLQFLIPLCNPKDRNSYSLQMALYGKHLDCLDELIPVSDPEAALQEYKKVYRGEQNKYDLLQQSIARYQRKMLHDHIKECGTHVKRKL